ncbi:Zn-ribbon domain-containing OB-fold protein [Aquipuribacter nitratireducens]|uniref:Zn-ribbon domain-containing OB-fold protein n=1 Tax=Aquipuribacter nitratireducens TaxID=650104 RepID=A0ABW0GN89_9MICO
MSERPTRPAFVPRGEERLFYDRLREHELVFQRCTSCARVVFPLRTVCPGCGSETALTVERAEGGGVVHSWTTQHRAPHPHFATPLTLALADLDEGFRVLAAVPEPTDLAVGARVRVGFDDVDPDLTLLRLDVVTGRTDPEEARG